MPLPKLTSCCCGCSLKTGTIIIGSLSLAASVLLALMAIWLLASANSFMEILEQALDTGHWSEDKDPDNMIVGERGQREGNVGNFTMETADTTVAVVNVVGGVVLALAVLGIVLPSCLIHGARTVGTATVCWGPKSIVLSYQHGVVI